MPPSPKEAETVTEYRVFGVNARATAQEMAFPTPWIHHLPAAESWAKEALDIGWTNVRIQSRTVTTTPWEDVTETNQGAGDE